jgi:hypothetical protein
MPQQANWWRLSGGIPISAGIIMGFDGTTAPDGWALYTTADGRAILGTTLDGDVEATGGSATAGTRTSSTGGSHSGSYDVGIDNWRQASGTSTDQGRDDNNYGSHSHTVYSNIYAAKSNVKFIRATGDSKVIPTNAIGFQADTSSPAGFAEMTTLNTFDGFLHGSTTVGTTSASSSHGVSTNTLPSHDHNQTHTGSRVNATTKDYINDASYSHSHSVSPSVSRYMKNTVLKLWKATEDVRKNATGIIALYNGAGVPDGWLLCDGTSGTPNMSGYFTKTSGTAGAVDNTSTYASISGTLSSQSHAHTVGGTPASTGTTVAHQNNVAHNHTVSGTVTWTPPYIKLKFIKYAG